MTLVERLLLAAAEAILARLFAGRIAEAEIVNATVRARARDRNRRRLRGLPERPQDAPDS